jgi:hypothetical protein
MLAPNGDVTAVDIDLGAELHGSELAAMQFIVGGFVQKIPTGSDQFCMFANEDGLQQRLDPNPVASALATAYAMYSFDIVGTVVITGREKQGETTGLSDEQIRQMFR